MKVNSQLERAQLENLTSLPAAATAGRVAWDSVAGKAFLDDATNWRAFLRNDQKAIIGNSGTAADNVRFHRGANGVLQVVSGADATAEGTLSTALNQLSFRAENYSTGSLPTFGSVGRIAFDTTTGFPKFDTGAAWKEIVDSSSTQTISGKTLVSPTVNSALTGEQITTPSNPASGFNKIYPKSDGKWYNLKSDGSEDPLGSGSGSGGINYIANPTADSNTLGWATYADAAGNLPVDGTGGSPSSTFTRSTTTPLRGAASFLWTKSAANRQGEGFSYDFTIDTADTAKVMTISFDYFVASGTYADGDLTVYIYDVTNAQIIQPAGYTIQNSLVKMKQTATFQTASNSTSYRLIVHTASTSASAYSLQFDNFSVGPQVSTSGFEVSATAGMTGVIALTSGVYSTVIYNNPLKDTHGSYNSSTGVYTVPVSGIYQITASAYVQGTFTQVDIFLTDASNTGIARLFTGSGTLYPGGVYEGYFTAGQQFKVRILVSGTGLQVYSDSQTTFLGIKGPTATPASDTDTRVVAAQSSGASSAVTSGNPVIYPTTNNDTHGAYNPSTGRYQVPVSGYYQINFYANGAASIVYSLYKNAASQQVILITPAGGAGAGSGLIYANAGDLIDVRPNGNTTPTGNFSINRLSGPSTIAASETVAAGYSNHNTQTLLGGYTTNNIKYTNKYVDTHNAYDTSTGLYTVPVSGIYRVSGMFHVSTAQATGDDVYLAVFVNGGQIYQYRAPFNINDTLGTHIHGTVIYRLLAGQTVSIGEQHGPAGSKTLANNAGEQGNFSIERIGN